MRNDDQKPPDTFQHHQKNIKFFFKDHALIIGAVTKTLAIAAWCLVCSFHTNNFSS